MRGERCFAPKALDKLKDLGREITCRTRGIGLQQIISALTPYLVGWRGYLGFLPDPARANEFGSLDPPENLYIWR